MVNVRGYRAAASLLKEIDDLLTAKEASTLPVVYVPVSGINNTGSVFDDDFRMPPSRWVHRTRVLASALLYGCV